MRPTCDVVGSQIFIQNFLINPVYLDSVICFYILVYEAKRNKLRQFQKSIFRTLFVKIRLTLLFDILTCMAMKTCSKSNVIY